MVKCVGVDCVLWHIHFALLVRGLLGALSQCAFRLVLKNMPYELRRTFPKDRRNEQERKRRLREADASSSEEL